MDFVYTILVLMSVVLIFIIVYNKNNRDKYSKETSSTPYNHFENINIDHSPLFTNNLTAKREGIPYILVLDTETFDAIDDEYDSNTSNNKVALPVSISWALLDEKLIVLKEEVHILRQSGSMDRKAIDIHGISNKDMFKGESPRIVIEKLSRDLEKVNIISAHNLKFHLSVIKSELDVLSLKDLSLDEKIHFCTMIWGMKNNIIVNKYSGESKYPRLTELFGHLYFNNPNIVVTYKLKPLRDIRLVTACLKHIYH